MVLPATDESLIYLDHDSYASNGRAIVLHVWCSIYHPITEVAEPQRHGSIRQLDDIIIEVASYPGFLIATVVSIAPGKHDRLTDL